MVKLIVSCRNFANARKEQRWFKRRCTWGYISSRVWRCVTYWSVPDVSKDLDAWRSRHYVLRIVGDRLPNDAVSYPRRTESSNTSLWTLKQKVLLRA
jgi:hypothetical protein